MSAHTGSKRPNPKEVLLPVTRLVATWSMTIQNGQLMPRPSLLPGAALS
jgi:hypothetical protein